MTQTFRTENEFALDAISLIVPFLLIDFQEPVTLIPEVPRSNIGNRYGHTDLLAVLNRDPANCFIQFEFKLKFGKEILEQCRKVEIETGIKTIPVTPEHLSTDSRIERFCESLRSLTPRYRSSLSRLYWFYSLGIDSHRGKSDLEKPPLNDVGKFRCKRLQLCDFLMSAFVNLFRVEGKILSYDTAYSCLAHGIYEYGSARGYYRRAVNRYKNECEK